MERSHDYNVCVRIVQLQSPPGATRVAVVEEPRLHLLDGYDSVYALCQTALATSQKLADVAQKARSAETLEYDPIYTLQCEWRLLPPWTHPEPARCLVTGTG